MYLSGIAGISKLEILKNIPTQYTVKSLLISKEEFHNEQFISTLINEFTFPIIVKPNVGERGNGVERVNSLNHFYAIKHKYNKDVIIQEYIDYKYEFGVMFYQIPGSNEHNVSSIVEKVFLKVNGDGISSIKELLKLNKRAVLVWDYLEEILHDTWNYIPEKGEVILPQPIGNHCKGTMFIDANHLNNEKVTALFHRISNEYPGFNYGRFDLKVKSLEDLETGENLKIMELNGVTSEPAHVYDPKMTLLKAYKDIYHHFNIIYRISKVNTKNGYKSSTWKEFVGLLKKHYSKSTYTVYIDKFPK